MLKLYHILVLLGMGKRKKPPESQVAWGVREKKSQI